MKLFRAIAFALAKRRIIEYRGDIVLAILSAFLIGVGFGTWATVGANL